MSSQSIILIQSPHDADAYEGFGGQSHQKHVHMIEVINAAGQMDFRAMLKVFFAILLAAMGISQARETFPDLTKASGAVQRVFSVIDRRSAIDIYDCGGKPLPLTLS